MVDPESSAQATEWLGKLGSNLDPPWVAFMTTLAQPAEPITFQEGELEHPFTEQLGRRGRVVTFGSQYRASDDWNEWLLADLAFLTSVGWGECYYGHDSPPIESFLCDLNPNIEPLTDEDIRVAAQVEPHRWDWVSDIFEDQFLFDHEGRGVEWSARMSQAVCGQRSIVVRLPPPQETAQTISTVNLARPWVSPGEVVRLHGHRLVGALTCQSFRDQ